MTHEGPPVSPASEDYTKIFVTVFVILITLVLFALYRRRKTSRTAILLTGLCDSGKTLIFSQLIYRKHILTHTSIKENISNYIVNNNDVLRIIDVPGHERLRDKFFEEYKSMAKGIVFVVDSLTLSNNIRDAAEYLYNILTDAVVAQNRPKLLILCNKQDCSLAKGSHAVKAIFEKELNTLRVTKASQLQSVDPKGKQQSLLLGRSKGDFTFSSLSLSVDFAESSASNENEPSDIEQLTSWITNV